MQISVSSNTALLTGLAISSARTLYYASFIATEQVTNQIRSSILLERTIDLRIPGQYTRSLYPHKPYKARTVALPKSIYVHTIVLADDPQLALLLDPAHPAPATQTWESDAADKRRTDAQRTHLPAFHALAAQAANAAVLPPILPEWIPILFTHSTALAHELECFGDALHGAYIKPGTHWEDTVRTLLRRGLLPWPQPPITVSQPDKENSHETGRPRETRLLPYAA